MIEFKREKNKLLSNKEQREKINNEEFKKQLRLEFLNGKSIETLRLQFGLSTSFVKIAFKECNFTDEEKLIIKEHKSKKIILSDFQKEEIKRLYIDGYGQIRISKILGLDQWIIRTRIKELGLKELNISGHENLPAKKEFTDDFKENIKFLYFQGVGVPKLGEMLNISPTTASKLLKSIGVKLGQIKPKQIIPTERQCRGECQLILPINRFRSRFRKGRTDYEYMCRECAQIYSNLKQNIRRKNNPMSRIRDTIGRQIQNKLKLNNQSKNYESSFDYLPYTVDDLKNHIESQFNADYNLTPNGEVWMNFDNWGAYNPETWDDNNPTTWIWQLDHIIPHCTFNYDSMEHPDFIKCWSLDNLRPYSAKLNAIENDRGYRLTKK